MSRMKNIMLPILEEIAEGPDTRVNLHTRCKHIVPSWSSFKRILSALCSNELVERKGWVQKPESMGPETFGLTKDGTVVVESFTQEA